MADFRKLALAFAGVACFIGMSTNASAQPTLNGITCFANAATPLQDRAEGITELTGDLVLTCTGGTPTAFGSAVPQVNITVALNTQVTSRLVGGTTNITEAILMLNDFQPGTQALCPATAANNYACTTVVLGTGAGGGKGITLGNGPLQYVNANVYQGVLTATNQLTFFNVPVDPPGSPFVSGGVTITPTLSMRITNVRANATALGAPTGFSTSTINESISTSAGIPITGPLQTVGSVFQGLVSKSTSGLSSTISNTVSLPLGNSSGGAPTLTQCSSRSLSSTSNTAAFAEYVNFSEGFATATKLRYAPSFATESIPGNSQNVEGGLVLNSNPTANNGQLIGAADFATRIKLTFGNIPAGVTLYTPTTLPANTLANGLPTEVLTLTQGGIGNESAPFNPTPASTVTNLPGTVSGQTPALGTIYGGWAALTLTDRKSVV